MERCIGTFVSPFWLGQYGMTGKETVEIRMEDPRHLLCPARLDLVSKILYVRSRLSGRGRLFSHALYRACIRAFLGPCYNEVGTTGKVGIRRHYLCFNDLIDNAVTRGIDPAISAVSLTNDGVVIDGAHRTATAYVLGQKVPVFEIPGVERNCNDAFFRSRGLDRVFLESLAYSYASLIKNPAVLLLTLTSNEMERRVARDVVTLCAPLACECMLDKSTVLYVLGCENAWDSSLLLSALTDTYQFQFQSGTNALHLIKTKLRIGSFSYLIRFAWACLIINMRDFLQIRV